MKMPPRIKTGRLLINSEWRLYRSAHEISDFEADDRAIVRDIEGSVAARTEGGLPFFRKEAAQQASAHL